MYKHNLWLLLLLAMILFGACSAREKTYLIGVSQCSEDLWRTTVNGEIMRQASLYDNIDVEIRSVKDDSDAQVSDIRYFIDKGVDLLVVAPNESEPLTPIISETYQKGIPVVLFDRKISGDNYTAYVGADNKNIGTVMGRSMIAYLGGKDSAKGNVVLLRGTKGSTADKERYEGLMDALKEVDVPNVKIIAELEADFSKDKAYEVMKHLLNNLPIDLQIDNILAFNDQMAAGARLAYNEDEHRVGHVPHVIGIDGLSGVGGGIEYMQEGLIDDTFVYPTGGDIVVEVARKILLNIPYEKENLIQTSIIDRIFVQQIADQRELFASQLVKFDELNKLTQNSLVRYTRQKQLNYALIGIVALSVISLIVLIWSYFNSRKYNHFLHAQNDKIRQQVDELELQKEQLLAMSRQLEEATQAKLVFFTNVSHEFKTPLSLIINPIKDALNREDIPQEAKSSLLVAERNSQKLLQLISEILDFRAHESGKMALQYQRTDFKKLIEATSQLFLDIMRKRKIHFSIETSEQDGIDSIIIDPKRMEKVYANLLSNAIKHVENGGTILVRLRTVQVEGNPEMELSVHNSGSYIPEEVRDKLFQSFYTLDIHQNGTGIGLALASAIVDAHEGTISVESSEQMGTTFIVSMPFKTDKEVGANGDVVMISPQSTVIYAENDEISSYQDALDEMQTSDKPVLLVIEDNVDMRQYIKSSLSADYHVIVASDGDKGISKALSFNPQLILSDIMMPGKDGIEVCKVLKANKQTEHIPVVLMTANSMEEQRISSYENGADGFLQKPFDIMTLKAMIINLLDKNSKLKSVLKNDWLIGRKSSSLSNGSSEMLNNIKHYVEEHIDEAIGVDDMIQHLGLSRSKFYRDLKEITDYSPIDLVNLIKLRKAIDGMIHEGKTITEAAIDSGFSSSSYFSRAFLKYYNERPKDYINRMTHR